MRKAGGGQTRVLAVALMVPYWVNEILRAFAFRVIFGSGGLINAVLHGIGLIDQPIDFIRANVALYAGLSLRLYAADGLPDLQRDREPGPQPDRGGARHGRAWWRIHWRVVIPFAKPGITSGCTMVFMLAAGALAAPQILGGPSSLWFTQIIYRTFFESVNWPRGAAYAVILLVVCTAVRPADDAALQGASWARSADERGWPRHARRRRGLPRSCSSAFLFGPLVIMSITAFNCSSFPRICRGSA